MKKYQYIAKLISLFIVVNILIQPINPLVELILESHEISIDTANDYPDNNESDSGEAKEDPKDKKNHFRSPLFLNSITEVLSKPIKIQHSQWHNCVYIDIILPPPEFEV